MISDNREDPRIPKDPNRITHVAAIKIRSFLLWAIAIAILLNILIEFGVVSL